VTTQLERIDIALTEAGKTRHELADEIGVARQAIYRLARRPGSSLKPENLAHVSRALHCDLYWLCTGEGGHYVPTTPNPGFSFLAAECARLLDQMPESNRDRAFVVIYQMSRGTWPVMPANPPRPPNPGLDGKHKR
jgi:transcriptional regulator with XRE-family HTH domain